VTTSLSVPLSVLFSRYLSTFLGQLINVSIIYCDLLSAEVTADAGGR